MPLYRNFKFCWKYFSLLKMFISWNQQVLDMKNEGSLDHVGESLLTMWFLVRPLGHMLSTWPLEGMETKASHEVVCNTYMTNPWTPKPGELPRLAIYSVHIATHTQEPFWPLLSVPFPVVDLHLHPLAVINSSHECSSSTKFWVLLVNYWIWESSWNLPNLQQIC